MSHLSPKNSPRLCSGVKPLHKQHPQHVYGGIMRLLLSLYEWSFGAFRCVCLANDDDVRWGASYTSIYHRLLSGECHSYYKQHLPPTPTSAIHPLPRHILAHPTLEIHGQHPWCVIVVVQQR
mmetsp:Transcript_3245/g.5961  ORF Transcript_3245/g.5961 Transcript_3245/m.5961 type:complete len:122 (-) Transcript_3245:1943-2308(-)